MKVSIYAALMLAMSSTGAIAGGDPAAGQEGEGVGGGRALGRENDDLEGQTPARGGGPRRVGQTPHRSPLREDRVEWEYVDYGWNAREK